MALVTTNLQLGIHLCQTNNCKTLKLSETTGVYNISTNPTGWDSTGATNPAAANATRVRITIVTPSGTYSFDSDPLDANYYAPLVPLGTYFPDPTGVKEFMLTASNLGGSVGDGIYSVTYKVYGAFGANTYEETVTQTFLLTCNIRCCIDKLFQVAAQSDCTDCKNEKLDKALEAESYLKAAEYAAACGKTNMANKHLAKAQWICSTKNCTNC